MNHDDLKQEVESKVIPIREVNSPEQHRCGANSADTKENVLEGYQPRSLRNMAIRYMHVSMAAMIGIVLPILSVLLYVMVNKSELVHSDVFTTGLATTLMIGGGVIGVPKCSPMYALSGIALAALVTYTSPILWSGVLVGLPAVYIGMLLAHFFYNEWREPHRAKMKALTEREKLNPRCTDCYIRKVCPMQPGGFIDRYTPTDER